METFLTVAAILGLTAGFAYCNQHFLRLQQTIGLMLLALGFTLMLALLKVLGLNNLFEGLQAFVTRISLNDFLLNGVLCFMLFAGSINVKSRDRGAAANDSGGILTTGGRQYLLFAKPPFLLAQLDQLDLVLVADIQRLRCIFHGLGHVRKVPGYLLQSALHGP